MYVLNPHKQPTVYLSQRIVARRLPQAALLYELYKTTYTKLLSQGIGGLLRGDNLPLPLPGEEGSPILIRFAPIGGDLYQRRQLSVPFL